MMVKLVLSKIDRCHGYYKVRGECVQIAACFLSVFFVLAEVLKSRKPKEDNDWCFQPQPIAHQRFIHQSMGRFLPQPLFCVCVFWTLFWMSTMILYNIHINVHIVNASTVKFVLWDQNGSKKPVALASRLRPYRSDYTLRQQHQQQLTKHITHGIFVLINANNIVHVVQSCNGYVLCCDGRCVSVLV